MSGPGLALSTRRRVPRVSLSISRVQTSSGLCWWPDYGDVLGKPEFKVLLNNRWGAKVYTVSSSFSSSAVRSDSLVQRSCWPASDVHPFVFRRCHRSSIGRPDSVCTSSVATGADASQSGRQFRRYIFVLQSAFDSYSLSLWIGRTLQFVGSGSQYLLWPAHWWCLAAAICPELYSYTSPEFE